MILFLGLDGLSYTSFSKNKSYFSCLKTNQYNFVQEKKIQCSFPPSSEPNWSGIIHGVPASTLEFGIQRKKWKKAKQLDQMVPSNIFQDFKDDQYITCSITNWPQFYGDVVDEQTIDIPILMESIDEIPMILDQLEDLNHVFVFLLIKDIDHIAHQFGENSIQYLKTLKHVNEIISYIVDHYSFDFILITADHGRDGPNGFEHTHTEDRTMTIPMILFSQKKIDLRDIKYNYQTYFILNEWISNE